MLSKPWLESSLGSRVSTSTSTVEQIANRVLIFGAIEATEGVGAARIGMRRGHAIERRFEVRNQPVVGRFVGSWATGRRHRARAQLADDQLPALGIGTDIGDIQRAEDEISLLRFLVMAAGAVTVQKGVLGRLPRLRGFADTARRSWGGFSSLFGARLQVSGRRKQQQRKSDSARYPTPTHSTSGLTRSLERALSVHSIGTLWVVAFCRKRMNLLDFRVWQQWQTGRPPHGGRPRIGGRF